VSENNNWYLFRNADSWAFQDSIPVFFGTFLKNEALKCYRFFPDVRSLGIRKIVIKGCGMSDICQKIIYFNKRTVFDSFVGGSGRRWPETKGWGKRS